MEKAPANAIIIPDIDQLLLKLFYSTFDTILKAVGASCSRVKQASTIDDPPAKDVEKVADTKERAKHLRDA